MKQNSSSTLNGESNGATIGNHQVTQSSNVVSPSTLGTLDTTADPKNRKDSPPTVNLQDATNASRMLQALSGSKPLKALVEWKKLELADGRECIALIFPLDKWQIDPSGELVPR